jgi:fatty-acyl-CoA synthase
MDQDPPLPPTLDRRIAAVASSACGTTKGMTIVSGEVEVRRSWTELHGAAQHLAAALQDRGVGPGTHVGLLGPTTSTLVETISAVWAAGATLVVLPLPMRLASIEAFVAQTRDRLRAADIALLVIDTDLAPFIQAEPGDPPMVTTDELVAAASTAAPFRPVTVDPDSLAVIQFTSGSTADPKGVMLPHRTVCANLDAIAEAATLSPDDVMVSWLPLYHDMGLVGFLMLPSTTGIDLVLGAPQDFLAKPLRWMEWIHRHRGTATAGPNFAWILATRALERSDPLDLSCLRIALNGAEPVDPASVEAFVATAARHGLHPGAVFPAFGMAEVVIGGAFPAPMAGMQVDEVDGALLDTEHVAVPRPGGRRLVRLGRAVPGLEFRITDPATGEVRAGREVGELEIRGSSVTPGYYGRPDLAAVLFQDGWFRTGDLGYLVDGELVLCGRIKDVIIIGGRNLHPQDIERAVGAVDGVRAGNVVAFGVPGRGGKEGVVVVAETRETDHDALRHAVTRRVTATLGVPPKDVVFLAPGSLPKTSSGKLQRSATKAEYLDGVYSSTDARISSGMSKLA